jgi:hypothetical protein
MGGYFWVYASALLVATLRASNRLIDLPFDDLKHLCMKLWELTRAAAVWLVGLFWTSLGAATREKTLCRNCRIRCST